MRSFNGLRHTSPSFRHYKALCFKALKQSYYKISHESATNQPLVKTQHNSSNGTKTLQRRLPEAEEHEESKNQVKQIPTFS